jgi:hypothetical protein
MMDEGTAIAAGYYNDSAPGSFVYTHADHLAVQRALFDVDHGLPGPQLGRTARGAPAAAERGRTEVIDEDLYRSAMEVGDDGRRLGPVQSCYGWLSDAPWPAGELDVTTPWSRSQTFWERY